MPYKQFSHNKVDTIYNESSPNSLRFAFLVVSEFFDTPSEAVTAYLDAIVDFLNNSKIGE